MEAKELRIGNIIGFEIGHHIVRAQDILDCENGLWKDKDVYPIPLTEEWLVKFGFVCDSDGYCHLPTKGISFNDYKSNMINLCVGTHCQEGENLPHIKYVHQLQNLYFALTGQELTINE